MVEYKLTPEDKEWMGFPADGRAELQPVIDGLRARVTELEAIHNNTRAELAKWRFKIPEQAFNDLANALNP